MERSYGAADGIGEGAEAALGGGPGVDDSAGGELPAMGPECGRRGAGVVRLGGTGVFLGGVLRAVQQEKREAGEAAARAFPVALPRQPSEPSPDCGREIVVQVAGERHRTRHEA